MNSGCVISCSSGESCVFSGGTCYAKGIPNMCSGAVTSSAIYNIGRINSILPGYNPSNTWVSAYNFVAADLLNTWQPAVYSVSGGSISIVNSGGISTSGGLIQVCQGNYNVNSEEYHIISWYEPAISAGGSSS